MSETPGPVFRDIVPVSEAPAAQRASNGMLIPQARIDKVIKRLEARTTQITPHIDAQPTPEDVLDNARKKIRDASYALSALEMKTHLAEMTGNPEGIIDTQVTADEAGRIASEAVANTPAEQEAARMYDKAYLEKQAGMTRNTDGKVLSTKRNQELIAANNRGGPMETSRKMTDALEHQGSIQRDIKGEKTEVDEIVSVPSSELRTDYSGFTDYTPEQLQSMVLALEPWGELRDGRFELKEFGKSFYAINDQVLAEMVRIPPVNLPEGIPQPVTTEIVGDTIFVTFNFPVGCTDIGTAIQLPKEFMGKRAIYRLRNVHNLRTFHSLTPDSGDIVIDNLTLDQTRNIDIATDATVKIADIKAYEGVTLGVECGTNSTTILPLNTHSLMGISLTADDATLMLRDSQGRHTAYEHVRCKDIAVGDYIFGTSNRDTKAPTAFTTASYMSQYSPTVLEQKIRQQPPESDAPKTFKTHGVSYEVVGYLGAGNYAQVFLGKNESGEYAVLKVAGANATANKSTAFLPEIGILQQLQSAQTDLGFESLHTPRHLGYDRELGRENIVMTLAEGISVRDLIGLYGTDVADSIEIARQSAQVCAALHKIGKTYKDIQPNNFYWDPIHRNITCIDFNLVGDLAERRPDGTPIKTVEVKSLGTTLFTMVANKTFDHNVNINEQLDCIPNVGNLRQIVARAINGEYESTEDLEIVLALLQQDYASDIKAVGVFYKPTDLKKPEGRLIDPPKTFDFFK